VDTGGVWISSTFPLNKRLDEILMNDLKIETPLTLDNHFSIMGFEVIPPDKK